MYWFKQISEVVWCYNHIQINMKQTDEYAQKMYKQSKLSDSSYMMTWHAQQWAWQDNSTTAESKSAQPAQQWDQQAEFYIDRIVFLVEKCSTISFLFHNWCTALL